MILDVNLGHGPPTAKRLSRARGTIGLDVRRSNTEFAGIASLAWHTGSPTAGLTLTYTRFIAGTIPDMTGSLLRWRLRLIFGSGHKA